MTVKYVVGGIMSGNARIGKSYPVEEQKAGRQPLVQPWSMGQPVWSDWRTDKGIEHGLKASAVVYACVRKLSSAAASVPWRVEKREGEKWVPVPNHPIEMLLSHPNPFMTRQDLIERLTQHLNLGGNGVWHMVKRQGLPVEMWPLMPDRIKPVPAPRKYISHYEYDLGNGTKKKLSANEIIHFQFSDPGNPYWGMSPLQAVAKVVDSDVEAVTWNKVSLQNRAVPDGVFMINAPNATHQQWTEARDQVRRRYLEKGREPWVLFNVDYKQMSLSPVEMDFLNSRRFTREEIASVFGVLPILIGAMDGTTYNNIHVAKRIFWEDTIIPFLDDIRDSLRLTLLPYFDPTANDNSVPDTLRIQYDLSNIAALQDNYAKKVQNAKILFDMGMPLKQINQRLELGFLDGDIPEEAVRAVQTVNSTGQMQADDGEGDRNEGEPGKEAKSVARDMVRERITPTIVFSARKAAEAGKTVDAVEIILDMQKTLTRELESVHMFLSSAFNTKRVIDSRAQAVMFSEALALKMAALDEKQLVSFTKDAIVSVVANFAALQVKLHMEGE